MANFDEREKAFEAKFKLDQDLVFKVDVRRARLLGAWAAGKLGHGADQSTAYQKEMVQVDFEKPGDDDMIDKIAADFKKAGVSVSREAIKEESVRLLAEAKKQLMAEADKA